MLNYRLDRIILHMQLSLIDGLEFNVMRYEEIPLPTSNDKVNNKLKDSSKLKKNKSVLSIVFCSYENTEWRIKNSLIQKSSGQKQARQEERFRYFIVRKINDVK